MDEENTDNSAPKRPRTKEDFNRFCNYVLEYTKYEEMIKMNNSESDIPATTESFDSETIDEDVTEPIRLTPEATTSNHKYQDHGPESHSGTTRCGWMTCNCEKSLVTRPMVKCSSCQIWVHLSCLGAKINSVPDNFKCILCDPRKANKRARRAHRNARRRARRKKFKRHLKQMQMLCG